MCPTASSSTSALNLPRPLVAPTAINTSTACCTKWPLHCAPQKSPPITSSKRQKRQINAQQERLAMKIAQRAQRIEPFYVMEVAKAASALAQEFAHTASPMIFLNIGEPDFTAPPLVQQAATRAIAQGMTQYTQATGLPALRERISDWYSARFGAQVAPGRIIVTAGASAALQLACLALIEAGDEVLMPDPSYPCNRHFVSAAEG